MSSAGKLCLEDQCKGSRRCVCVCVWGGGGGGGYNTEKLFLSSTCKINPFTAVMSLPKVRNLKPLNLFFSFFFFALACERIFIKTYNTESSCVTGPENILFAGASVHLSAPEILQAGAVQRLNLDASERSVCVCVCVGGGGGGGGL